MGNLLRSTYLSGILERLIEVLFGDTGPLLESLQVGEFSIGAESENQKIKELLGLRCPLTLDNTRSCPRSLPDVMSVKLLLWPMR